MAIIQAIGGVVGLVVVITTIVVSFMKGKPVLGLAGIGFGALSLIGATRLAKPDSRWAKSRYDRTYLALSQGRFPDRVNDDDRVPKSEMDEVLDGWTTRPPHATELESTIGDRLAVPGRWIVAESPNEVTYRKPLIPHAVMLIVAVLLLPLWPIVGGIWLYLTLVGNEQRHHLSYAEGTGITEEKLGRAEHSYPVGLTRTAWREASEFEAALPIPN